jgi:serine/threonine protein kinase/tetratricopeptide (TPR) repeat protein
MTQNAKDLPSLFLAALELDSESTREKFIDQSCGENLELKQQLQALLLAHQQVGGFLNSPPSQIAMTLAEEAEPRKPAVAPSSPTGHSILKLIGQTAACEMPRVILDSSAGEIASPLVRPHSRELPSIEPGSRYQVHGEIARGGMGAILKGRDTDLGRDLAIKVLLEEHRGKPALVQRFVEEAQIGGQLQHPGIVPVYELGQFGDQRPYFSMKLVNGKTLAAMLEERHAHEMERAKFLGIFEQVCQTMAYSHSRKVIHRDLKPSNIMVGAFGEVQVMDWGLAKVLTEGGIVDEKRSFDNRTRTSIIHTIRSLGSIDTPAGLGSGSNTQMGSVLGTPAYMPPEQALGEIDRLDERSDVFGLGAILCEILTGDPPYTGLNQTEVFRKASRAKLEECFERLDQRTIDAELRSIVVDCLRPEPEERIRDAGVLARRLSNYIESVETRMREVELARVAADIRAGEESKRRRVTLALAATLLLAMGLGGGGYLWLQHQQARLAASQAQQALESQIQRSKLASQINSEVALARASIETDSESTPDENAVQRALEAVGRASQLLATGEHPQSLQEEVEELTSRLTRLKRDQQLIRDLEIAWQQDMEHRAKRNWRIMEQKNSRSQFHSFGEQAYEQKIDEVLVLPRVAEPDSAYRDAFAKWGLTIGTTSVDEAARMLDALHPTLKPMALTSLDRWRALTEEPWSIERWQQAEWSSLQPIELISRGGDQLTELDDGSILASGDNAWAGYNLVFETDVQELTAMRLEVMLHPSLPNLGPGRAGDGMFGMHTLVVEVAPRDNLGARQQLSFSSATADYSQARRPIEVSRWHIGGGGGRPHVAVFQTAETVRSPNGFRFWISHGDRARDRWQYENLGRFRWSATGTSPSSTLTREGLTLILGVADADPWRQMVRQDLKNADLIALTKRISDLEELDRQPVQLLTQIASNLVHFEGSTLIEALPKNVRWSSMENVKVESTHGSIPELQRSGSIIVSGPNPDSELLQIEGSLGLPRFSGVKLDLITTLDKPTRHWARINMCVCFRELSVRIVNADGSTRSLSPKFVVSNHPHSQSLKDAIDGSEKTFALLNSPTLPARIVLGFDPIQVSTDQSVKVLISTGGIGSGGENLSRFRVSVTGDELLPDIYGSALKILERTVHRAPSDYWSRLALVEALLSGLVPQHVQAMRHATAAIALRPDHSSGYAALLRSIPIAKLADQRDYPRLVGDCIARLRELDAQHPVLAEFNRSLSDGIQVMASQEKNDQLAFIVDSLQDMQLASETLDSLSHTFIRLAHYELALKVCQRLKDIAPRRGNIANMMGVIYARMGDPKKANDMYRREIEFDPKSVLAHTNLAVALAAEGNLQEAIHHCQQAVDANPKYLRSYQIMGNSWMRLGEFQNAETAYRAGLEKDPSDTSLKLALASSLQKLGQSQESIQLRKGVIQGSPQVSAGELNNLAWQLVTVEDPSLRDPQEAVELSERAVKLDPKGTYFNTLGVAHYRSGNWQQAVETLTRSAESGEVPMFYNAFFLAMAHWQLEEQAEARNWYQKGVDSLSDGTNSTPEELRYTGKEEAQRLLGVETK